MIDIFIELIPAGIQQGLLLSIVAMGLMLSFRLLNLPDLTAEGSYTLGASLSASLMLGGLPALVATPIAALGGGIMGLGTGFLSERFKVNTLLGGIILSTMSYSIHLSLMKKPNVALFSIPTLFPEGATTTLICIIISIVCVSLLCALIFFLKTEKGLRLRAVGYNPDFASTQGIATSQYVLMGLFAANLLAALSGSLMAQAQQYVDVGMGVGIVIHALAALMLGEMIVGTRTLRLQLIAPLVGALLYQQIQGLVLSLGLPPSDLKFVTGAVLLLLIATKKMRKQTL
jgi:putative tryptophan/tyrosine transport system permease protein